MAPLFSKIDSNKLWRDAQNEQNVICAKFGKDLFNISKVIGRKKVAQFFFDSQCIWPEQRTQSGGPLWAKELSWTNVNGTVA